MTTINNNAFGDSTINAPLGDVNYFQATGSFFLSPFEEDAPPADWARQPSRLLNAAHAVVPFHGRGEEVRALTRWRDDPERLSLFLLHAAGGQGKSRLAAHFAAAGRGWRIWRAHPESALVPEGSPSTLDGIGERALILVDYADRWPHDALKALCLHASRSPARLRILLLARSVAFWWPLLGTLAEQPPAHELALAPLVDEHDRPRVYTDAAMAFARALATPVPSARVPRGLADRSYETVLAVHMRALATVLATRGDTAPDQVDEVAAFLLRREMGAWRELRHAGAQGRIDYLSGDRELAQAVFVASLAGPVAAYGPAVALLEKVRMPHADQVLADHRYCYPAKDRRQYLEPLYPDRLAEDFIALLVPGHRVETFPVNGWAETAPAALLTHQDGPAPAHTPRTLTALTSAALRWPHLVPVVDGILREDPGLAVAAGAVTLENLAGMTALDAATLDLVSEHLPSQGDSGMDIGAWQLVERLTGDRIAIERDPAVRASLHTRRGLRRISVGHHGPALLDLDAAADLFRRLAGVRPNDYAYSHANACHARSLILNELGRLEDSLASVVEAETLLGRLRDSGDHPVLLEILANKAMVLGRLDRHDEAEKTARDLMRRLRTSTAANMVAAGAQAAMSLAVSLRERGAFTEAVELLRAALDRCRAQDDGSTTAALRSHLLINLGTMCFDAGLTEEGTAATTEAVRIIEELHELNPGRHAYALAIARGNLEKHTAPAADPDSPVHRARRLTALGLEHGAGMRWAEALRLHREAVAIYRSLPAETWDALGAEPAGALGNLASALVMERDFTGAAAVTDQAEDAFRGLTGETSYHYEIAVCRMNRLACVAATRGLEPALLMSRELAAETEALCATEPRAWAVLQNVLGARHQLLLAAARHEEAAEVARRVAELPEPPPGTDTFVTYFGVDARRYRP